MTELQKVKTIVSGLKTLGYGSQKDIGVLVGYTNESAFSQVLNGKVALPGNLITRLIAIDPRVEDLAKTSLYKDSEGFLEEERKRPVNNIEIIEPKGKIITTGKNKRKQEALIPFYNADFMAGNSDLYYEDGTIYPEYFMDIPEFSGCTAFRAYSDSMEEKIRSGSILFGVKIDDWSTHLEYGQIYGITCTDGRRYLKYIRKAEDHKKFLLLKSQNANYDDFELPRTKVKNIWLIEGWIDKRT